MKKIILTEEQMRYIVNESLLENMPIDESVMTNIGSSIANASKTLYQTAKDKIVNDFKSCKTFPECVRTLALYISMGVLPLITAHELIKQNFPSVSQAMIQKLDSELEKETKEEAPSLEDMRLHQQRVDEVEKLMNYVAELNGRSDLLKLNADNIVTLCEKYNFSLPLLLAQAHLESHFGTTPRAQKTNSVFSVGSYDDGSNRCVYSSQDASVERYIKLMLSDYLNNKTVDQLLTPGGFVNHDGKRYASDKNYEQRVNRTMNTLVKRFCPSCFNN